MGKAALLAIAAFVVASTYYNLTSRDGQAGALRATSEHQLTVLARNAAVAGYGRAKQAIADEASFAPFESGAVTLEGTYANAAYQATITSDGTTATVESVGTISNAADDVQFAVHAVIGKTTAAASSVPPFLTYALLTEDDLLLNGNVGGYVDDEDSDFNANFHTNGDLHVNGNASDVAGFGSYVGDGTSNPKQALANTFQPPYNPDDAESVYRSAAVEVPAFDAEDFLASVPVDETSGGNVRISGDLDLGGTREDPYIWHVQGDLTASGGSSVSGYVMFVVDGDITISGNLVAGESGDESTIALYAGDDVTLNGNVQIHGQIYADGDVTFNGTPDVHGSVASGASAILNGTPGIHYRPASPALTTIFSDDSGLLLISYYEH